MSSFCRNRTAPFATHPTRNKELRHLRVYRLIASLVMPRSFRPVIFTVMSPAGINTFIILKI